MFDENSSRFVYLRVRRDRRWGSDHSECVPAVLALADGTIFRGQSIGAKGNTTGEVVFNTALTGYQEILTDPSYARQIVTLTYPHIGNTGTTPEDLESPQIYRRRPRHPRPAARSPATGAPTKSLPEFLERGTRRRDRRHRHAQAHAHPAREGRAGRLHHDRRARSIEAAAVKAGAQVPGPQGHGPRQGGQTKRTLPVERGHACGPDNRRAPIRAHQRLHVVAYDFGIKRNILRLLADRGCRMTVVPAQTPAEEVLALEPDGVFLSNGPGDPEPCDYAIEAIARAPRDRHAGVRHLPRPPDPGARQRRATVKMKFGHHGANHPVQDLDTGRVFITSQNHGFAVDEATLPANVRGDAPLAVRRLAAGPRVRTTSPAFSFQGHPEASPGPHDLKPLFDRFNHLMLRRLQAQLQARRGDPAPPAGDARARCPSAPTSRAS